MKSKKKMPEVPFTLQSFGLFFEKVLKPVLEDLKKMSKKIDLIHQEHLTISDQTRRIELRIQGATQQAVLVMRQQMETLRKRVEELEVSKPRNYH